MERNPDKKNRKARMTGILMTVALHLAAFALVSFSSISYLYPPPGEQSLLIDFSVESEMEKEYFSSLVRGEDVDKDQPVELVQRSESAYESEAPNLTPETQNDDFGDVEVPAPEQPEPPKLDPRASFPGMAQTDTTLTSPHAASEASDSFVAGQSHGNTVKGRTEGKPNAHLLGRTVKGSIALPEYSVQESGIVVVDIWVDNYGKVVKAVPGGDGTTVMDKSLLAAARNAALSTRFDENTEAQALQQGTITYYFNLN